MGYTIYKNKTNNSLKNQIVKQEEFISDWDYLESMDSKIKKVDLSKLKNNPDKYNLYLSMENNLNNNDIQINYYVGQKVKARNPIFDDRFLKVEVDGKGYFYTIPKQENKDCLNKLIQQWEETNEDFEATIEEADLKNYIFKVNLTATLQEEIFRNYIIEGIPVKAKAVSLLANDGYNMKLYFDDMELDAFMDIKESDIDILPNPSSILYKEIFVQILNYSHTKRCYLVSKKTYMESLLPDKLENLEKGGMLYEGFITGFSPNEKPVGNVGQRNGIFVQFNDGIRGKIYESDYNDETKKNLQNLKLGDSISFYIKSVKVKKNKVNLTQILNDHVWSLLKEEQEMMGEVFQLNKHGVFFKLDNDLIGLIHNIEQDTLPDFNPKVGEKYKVRILELNLNDKKINLTLASKPIEKKEEKEVVELIETT